MELRISPVSFPEKIEFNFDELKNELQLRTEQYANLVYTEDQIKEAKTDRATLRKLVDALETERKRQKKECLKPYEEFEAKVKELVALVNKPVALIDSQVKAYEEKQKEEKRLKITELFEGKKRPEWLLFENLFVETWLNASVSMKTIEEAIDKTLEMVANDLAIIAEMPEYSFEALQTYKASLDLRKAVSEAHRLSDMARMKAEYAKAEEERLKAEAEAKNVNLPEEVDPEIQKKIEEAGEPVEASNKTWLAFRALLTVDDAKALKEFFEKRNIEFMAI